MFYSNAVNHKGWNQRIFFLDRILETSDATYRHCGVTHTHAHTLKIQTHADIHVPAMLKTHHIFIRLKTIQEDNGANDKDHYDNRYGNDTDEYEEHLGSIDSLGKEGGVLLHVNYLTPCDLYCVETPEVTP